MRTGPSPCSRSKKKTESPGSKTAWNYASVRKERLLQQIILACGPCTQIGVKRLASDGTVRRLLLCLQLLPLGLLRRVLVVCCLKRMDAATNVHMILKRLKQKPVRTLPRPKHQSTGPSFGCAPPAGKPKPRAERSGASAAKAKAGVLPSRLGQLHSISSPSSLFFAAPQRTAYHSAARSGPLSALRSALRLRGLLLACQSEPGRRYSAMSPRRSLGPHRDIRPWRTESENCADGNGLEAPALSRIPQLKGGRSAEAC